jgi:hypothetical protein
MKKLTEIQNELKAPKNQYNAFGKYKYRSCEDILEAVKPLLKKHDCTLTITDEVKEVGGMVFVEAVATITDSDGCQVVKAQAGIDSNRKGMDIAQSFGSSSSYARKYALNGLFLIDDTKDADATNTHRKQSEPKKKAKVKIEDGSEQFMAIVDWVINGKKNKDGELVHGTIEKAKQVYEISESVEASLKEKIQSLQEITG